MKYWRRPLPKLLAIAALALLCGWVGRSFGDSLDPEGALAGLTFGFGTGFAIGLGYRFRICLWVSLAIGVLFATVGIVDDLVELRLFWDRGWFRNIVITVAFIVGIGGATALGAAVTVGLRWIVRRGRTFRYRPANATRPTS